MMRKTLQQSVNLAMPAAHPISEPERWKQEQQRVLEQQAKAKATQDATAGAKETGKGRVSSEAGKSKGDNKSDWLLG